MTGSAPLFFVETSCIVAAVCTWHTHHAKALKEIESRLEAGEQMATAAHALAETYAVLTRLPPPHRLAPTDALALIEGGFAGNVVALSADGYRTTLRQAAETGITGGRTYDALIAACAMQAGAAAIITFNARDYAQIEAAGVHVVVPGTEAAT